MVYQASPTMAKFHGDDHFVRALMGPIGSGKSVACCMELLLKAHQQEPDHFGRRKSRFAIIRNTYRELIDTTMQTFFDWIPKGPPGLYLAKDMKYYYNLNLSDGTTINAEFLFRALDKPTDIKKLLSLELTGGWINEAREIPKAVMDMLIGRLGRYPRSIEGAGPTWHGLIMDTNPPDSDHWWYRLFEEDVTPSYHLFRQPSGVSPEAENTAHLPAEYYTNMVEGKDQEWINVYVHGMYGFVSDGKPIYMEYNDDTHFADIKYEPDYRQNIYIGIDFGLTPAAIFCQRTATHRWFIFDELVCEDMGADNFSKLLNQHIKSHYPQYSFEIYGDPSGDFRAQTDEITPFQILRSNGVQAVPTYTNDFVLRREAVAAPLQRLDFAGNPGFTITGGAPITRKGMAGGYKYKRMMVTGHERFQDKPDKNRYSHPCEALQYALLGAGEGSDLIATEAYAKPIDYSAYNKMVV